MKHRVIHLLSVIAIGALCEPATTAQSARSDGSSGAGGAYSAAAAMAAALSLRGSARPRAAADCAATVAAWIMVRVSNSAMAAI